MQHSLAREATKRTCLWLVLYFSLSPGLAEVWEVPQSALEMQWISVIPHCVADTPMSGV